VVFLPRLQFSIPPLSALEPARPWTVDNANISEVLFCLHASLSIPPPAQASR